MTIEEELKAILAADLGAQDDPAKLAVILYNCCYTQSILDPQPGASPGGQALSPANLTPLLEAANQSRAGWDKGWKIDQMLSDGRILARKGALARAFLPGEYLTNLGIGSGPKPGALVNIFIAPGSAELQPGFYYAFGETVTGFQEDEQTVRFFWNVTIEGAAIG